MKQPCNIIQTGSYKLAGQELTEEVEAEVKSIVDKQYILLCKTVAKLRGIDAKALKLTDGKSFLASDALELNLIDEVGYFSDAIKALKTKLVEAGFDVENGIELLSQGQRSIIL